MYKYLVGMFSKTMMIDNHPKLVKRGGGHREREIEGGRREEERKTANRQVEA